MQYINLSHPYPGQREKIYWGAWKSFMKALKTPQRSVKIKI